MGVSNGHCGCSGRCGDATDAGGYATGATGDATGAIGDAAGAAGDAADAVGAFIDERSPGRLRVGEFHAYYKANSKKYRSLDEATSRCRA
jgi:hypothetical protein